MRWLRASMPTLLITLSGLVLGILAALLVHWGNPPNMGLCVACFMRDIAGALGFHRAEVVQYIRPEIPGFVIGSLAAAFAFREFRTRGGSAPLVRFLLGVLIMIGALVFLGCPIRATLRLAGGDLNGLTGLLGVAAGAVAGIAFVRQGFNLGRASRTPRAAGWVVPLAMAGLVLLALWMPSFVLFSKKGPGSQHAPLVISLLAGLAVGFLAQRTRMCFVGGFRDLFLIRDTYLFTAIAATFVGAVVIKLLLGQFKLGFLEQPLAHSDHLWNFLGMSLVGLGAILVGGCPFRQLVLSGEGDTDAAMTVLGIFAGAAIAHNFGLASSASGSTELGRWAVVVGLVIAAAIGLLMRETVSVTLQRVLPSGTATEP